MIRITGYGGVSCVRQVPDDYEPDDYGKKEFCILISGKQYLYEYKNEDSFFYSNDFSSLWSNVLAMLVFGQSRSEAADNQWLSHNPLQWLLSAMACGSDYSRRQDQESDVFIDGKTSRVVSNFLKSNKPDKEVLIRNLTREKLKEVVRRGERYEKIKKLKLENPSAPEWKIIGFIEKTENDYDKQEDFINFLVQSFTNPKDFSKKWLKAYIEMEKVFKVASENGGVLFS